MVEDRRELEEATSRLGNPETQGHARYMPSPAAHRQHSKHHKHRRNSGPAWKLPYP